MEAEGCTLCTPLVLVSLRHSSIIADDHQLLPTFTDQHRQSPIVADSIITGNGRYAQINSADIISSVIYKQRAILENYRQLLDGTAPHFYSVYVW